MSQLEKGSLKVVKDLERRRSSWVIGVDSKSTMNETLMRRVEETHTEREN